MKILSITVSLILLFALSACQSKKPISQNPIEKKVELEKLVDELEALDDFNVELNDLELNVEDTSF